MAYGFPIAKFHTGLVSEVQSLHEVNVIITEIMYFFHKRMKA